MKAKAIYILALLAMLSTSIEAQLTLTNNAARQCQEKDYVLALETIDRALQAEDEQNQAFTWYVSGYIHKEIFKEQESSVRTSPHRTTAVAHLEKALILDGSGEYSEMTRSALKYLATTYLNDALVMTREIQRSTEGQPEIVYAEFQRIMRIADPAASLPTYHKELFRKLAQAHYFLWEKDITQEYHSTRSREYYEKVLAMDASDCEANYNMAILLYNHGVHKIRKIGSSTDIMELIAIQDECIQLFRSSLPFAESTFNNCPERMDYFKAMMFINRALGNEDVHDEYKARLEKLIREGQIKK